MYGCVGRSGSRGAGWVGSCLVLLAVVWLLGGCRFGQSTVPTSMRLGVVDPQRVLGETNAGKKAKEMLASFAKNRQALIELEEKELRRMEEDFVKQGSVLSANAKREREEQFRRRMSEYQQKVTDLNREVQDKQKEVLDGFREKIEALSGKVAKRLELQAVFDRGRGGPTLYFDETVDVSSQVVEEFNKTYP
ncbi:MAG: OmpH family outer membrane protein [Nitrospira sp.]|jgi:outer membrane protein|nr:OmpH family outer membrane protein [Nitrospira sp.]MBP6607101.1 OmpH family outer membrane protein [Nitrospira sp.]MCI1279383.1 OmpH family outer membrane protein [Nitrospira sp.]HQY58654.1 OmpH family outer membrane protein [Nitrospira sp.]HRA97161.1 OmpH family outer membrane protein [Nitrospira sp.]